MVGKVIILRHLAELASSLAGEARQEAEDTRGIWWKTSPLIKVQNCIGRRYDIWHTHDALNS